MSVSPISTPLYPLFRKIPLLEKEEASDLKNFFNKQHEKSYFRESVNNRWGLKKGAVGPGGALVSFDADGRVKEQTLTHSYRGFAHYERFTEIVVKILEQLAKEMAWQGRTYPMGLTLMQHQLSGSDEIRGIEYHRDAGRTTLVVMLDDPSDPIIGWEGGEFLFRLTDAAIPLYRTTPECGYGILFSNEGTQHSVTSMKLRDPSRKWIDRTVLTIHESQPI